MSSTVPIVIAVILGVMVAAWQKDRNDWETFKTQNSCKKVAVTAPSTGTGYSFSGNLVIVNNPGQTGWLCADGVTYWR